MKKSFELGQKSKEPRGKRAFGASNTPSSAMNSKTVTFGRAATAGFSNFRSTKSVSPKRKTKFGKKVPLWVSNKKADVKVADLSEFLKNCSQHRDFTKEAMIAAFLRVNEMIYRLQEEEASFRVQIGQMKRENRSLSSEVALVEGDLEQINRNNLKDRSYYENQEVLLRKGLGIAPKSEACLQDTLKSISQSKAIDQKEKSVSLKKSLLKQPVTISKENEFLSKEIREIEKEIEGMSSFDYNRKKVNELYNQILNDQDDEESKSALLELVSRHRKVLESRSAQKAIQKEVSPLKHPQYFFFSGCPPVLCPLVCVNTRNLK